MIKGFLAFESWREYVPLALGIIFLIYVFYGLIYNPLMARKESLRLLPILLGLVGSAILLFIGIGPFLKK